MDEQSLRATFDKLMGCFERGDVAGFMAGLDSGLTMFDEDIPFRLDKAGFQQHVGLLAGNMESMAFIPRDTRFAVHGQTGVVDGYTRCRSSSPRNFQSRSSGSALFLSAELRDHLGGKLFHRTQQFPLLQAAQVHVHPKVRHPQLFLQ